MASETIPVILDTDIGSDIDDIWALSLLLKSPELDLKLITTCTSDVVSRTRITAKFLQRCGRDSIPIGIGIKDSNTIAIRHGAWADDYDLVRYHGQIAEDGVTAMIETIMNSPRPVTLIAIGPLGNVAEALRRQPEIARKTRLVGMQGSVARGYDPMMAPSKEYNVAADVKSAQAVFVADWLQMIITPLDTCGLVRLIGHKYRQVRDAAAGNAMIQALLENYYLWHHLGRDPGISSTLYDTVAVYLAFATEFCQMQRMGISVTDEGMTVQDSAARPLDVAMDWNDLWAFEDMLVERLVH